MARSVVIGIPTYRRPDALKALLSSLTPQLLGSDVAVVVADNASDPATVRAVDRFAQVTGCACRVVGVAAPGLAHVRNALVAEAPLLRPGWDWLVMLDDDGIADPRWWRALCSALVDGVDAVGGPVAGSLPTTASRLARNSIFAGRDRRPSGPVDMLGSTQNVAVSRRLLDALGSPWFDPRLAFSGGEDYEFFRRASRMGARFAWCDEAIVVEPAALDRLTARAMATRFFRNGVVGTQVDAELDGRGRTVRRLARDVGMEALRVGNAVARRDLDRLARCALRGPGLLGRAAGLVGCRVETYRYDRSSPESAGPQQQGTPYDEQQGGETGDAIHHPQGSLPPLRNVRGGH